jgi:hypothetical protein
LQWTVRPIVDNHGWDHESGIEGFSVDKAFLLRKKIPANVSGQVSVPRMACRVSGCLPERGAFTDHERQEGREPDARDRSLDEAQREADHHQRP